jgi:hypothetical protein
MATHDEIRRFIRDLLEEGRSSGEETLTLISGDIHKDMKLQNSMPSVCNIMYQLMGPNDQILSRTPSGKSSTIKIKYHFASS